MNPVHLVTSLFLLAALAACGDVTAPGGEDASQAGSAASTLPDPSDILAALPPEAQPYGLDVYTAKCVDCHGNLGQGIDKNPALKGLTPSTMQQKLLDYRAGKTQGAHMDEEMAGLSDAEIAAVSIYAGE
jgi:cytochrome c553